MVIVVIMIRCVLILYRVWFYPTNSAMNLSLLRIAKTAAVFAVMIHAHACIVKNCMYCLLCSFAETFVERGLSCWKVWRDQGSAILPFTRVI